MALEAKRSRHVAVAIPEVRVSRGIVVSPRQQRPQRDECLNINSFWSLTQARMVMGDWKHDYNHHRRHSSLGYLPPARYAATCTH